MKSALVVLVTTLSFSFGWENKNLSAGDKPPDHLSLTKADGDSSGSIQIINGSSLKRLPAVVKDLTLVLRKSEFPASSISKKNGIRIYLYDVTCKSFENAAAVQYHVNDTIYHLKLNRYNKQSTDKALAATLIHEFMHCVLLDIFNNARHGDEKALATIASFGANGNDTSQAFKNHFFDLINSGNDGQHELIYQIFYSRMVTILEGFAILHNEAFHNRKDAEDLMWSGLQQTEAYKKLQGEEKIEIESAILKEKRVSLNLEEY
jgi:hypothetical protein